MPKAVVCCGTDARMVDVRQAHADAMIGVAHKFLLGAAGVAFCWSGARARCRVRAFSRGLTF